MATRIMRILVISLAVASVSASADRVIKIIGIPLCNTVGGNCSLIIVINHSFRWNLKGTETKRQIYREQVLPHAGGKIPDTAFQTDRLFLNHLQKEGIAIPDGIVLEQRNPQVYQYFNKPMRNVFKVALSSDGRYTPDEGKYYYESSPAVETTYLVPQVHNYPERAPSNIPAYPVYRQLQIQNPLLNQPKLQPKKKSFFYLSPYSKNTESAAEKIKIIKPQTQTLNFLNDPLSTISNNQFNHNYDPSHLFNEFDNLFNNFQFDGSSGTYKSKLDKKPSKKNGSLN